MGIYLISSIMGHHFQRAIVGLIVIAGYTVAAGIPTLIAFEIFGIETSNANLLGVAVPLGLVGFFYQTSKNQDAGKTMF